jgi:hypothetical protein
VIDCQIRPAGLAAVVALEVLPQVMYVGHGVCQSVALKNLNRGPLPSVLVWRCGIRLCMLDMVSVAVKNLNCGRAIALPSVTLASLVCSVA